MCVSECNIHTQPAVVNSDLDVEGCTRLLQFDVKGGM